MSLKRQGRLNHQHRKKEENSTSSFSNPPPPLLSQHTLSLLIGNSLEFKNEQGYWYFLPAFYVLGLMRLSPQGAHHLTPGWRPEQGKLGGKQGHPG